jgi:hypothetical protein
VVYLEDNAKDFIQFKASLLDEWSKESDKKRLIWFGIW